MLRDFPKKKKVFSIADMKDVESGRARARCMHSGGRDAERMSLSTCSLKTAFQSISDDAVLGKRICRNRSSECVRDRGVDNLFEGSPEAREQMESDLEMGSMYIEEAYAARFRYGALSAEQKVELSSFCWNAFQTPSKNRLLGWANCFQKRETGVKKNINPKVFQVIDALKARATNTRFIFRYEPNKAVANGIANDLRDNKEIDCEGTDVLILANALKNYIREHLDGLIPIEAFKKIRSCIVANDRHRREALLSYLPFIFTDIERRLFKALFDLFRDIDRNYKDTEMRLDSLLGLFSLVLHPQAAFVTLDDLDHAQSIVKEICQLDFDMLPQAVVVHELVFV